MKEVMSLRDIAKELGITHQSVDILLKNAIRKVTEKLKKRGIKFEDLV